MNLIEYACKECARRVFEEPGKPSPRCVVVSEMMNDFPDGSFTYIKQGVSHGPMHEVGPVENPFAEWLEEDEEE